MATTGYATIVRVRGAYNPECEVFALTSEELPGLYLAGKNLQALHEDVPSVIKALYKLDCGMDVEVRKADSESERPVASATPSNFINLNRAFVPMPARAA